MKKSILIVGGTSGIGLQLAQHYVHGGHSVCITGRKDPGISGAQFHALPIGPSTVELTVEVDRLVSAFSGVQTLIYTAGFLQRGAIETLNDEALSTMMNVGLLAPAMLAARLKPLAPTPLKLMLVTSSSQYTPRPEEPAYAATKAGLGMLGASLVRDPGIGKVLVVAPSGVQTPFWKGTSEDTGTMLDPIWVSEQIIQLSSGAFKYRYAKLLRNPARTEIIENLDKSFAPIG